MDEIFPGCRRMAGGWWPWPSPAELMKWPWESGDSTPTRTTNPRRSAESGKLSRRPVRSVVRRLPLQTTKTRFVNALDSRLRAGWNGAVPPDAGRTSRVSLNVFLGSTRSLDVGRAVLLRTVEPLLNATKGGRQWSLEWRGERSNLLVRSRTRQGGWRPALVRSSGTARCVTFSTGRCVQEADVNEYLAAGVCGGEGERRNAVLMRCRVDGVGASHRQVRMGD